MGITVVRICDKCGQKFDLGVVPVDRYKRMAYDNGAYPACSDCVMGEAMDPGYYGKD